MKTKQAVLQFVREEGYQVSQSQFYKHCNDALLRPGKDGLYTKDGALKYAKLHLRRADTGQKMREWEEKLRQKKLKAETARAELQVEKERHDLESRQGKYVPREDFELALVARAVAFMAHLNHMVTQRAPDWIDECGGDQALASQLVHKITGDIEQHMATFAADAEFDVILEGK